MLKGERFVFAKAVDFLTRRFGLGANPVGSASVFEAVERVGEPEKGSASFAVLSWKHCLGPGLGRGKSFKVEALRSWSVPELKRFILRRLFQRKRFGRRLRSEALRVQMAFRLRTGKPFS